MSAFLQEAAVTSATRITGDLLWLLIILLFPVPHVDATSPQHDQVTAWYPNPSIVLRGFVDRTETGGNTFRFSIISAAGTELYKHEGEQYMGVAEYYLPPNREESALLVKWSSGNSFRLIVLLYRDEHVKVVNDLVFDSMDYSLLDVDGDIVPELIIFKQVPTKGQPVSQWPYSGEIYQWKNVGFTRLGSVPAADISRCILSHISPRQDEKP